MPTIKELQDRITNLKERHQAAVDSGIEDEAKSLQEDIDFLTAVEKEQTEKEEKKEEPKEEPEKPKEEPKADMSPEEIAQMAIDRFRSEERYNKIAMERNIRPDLIKTALESKPEDFDGDDGKYLDSVGLTANTVFEESVPTNPVKKVMGDKEFKDEELKDPNFINKNKDLLDSVGDVDESARDNIIADHIEKSGLAETLEKAHGMNSPPADGQQNSS